MIEDIFDAKLQSLFNITDKLVLVIEGDQIIFSNDAFLTFTGEKNSHVFPASKDVLLDYIPVTDRGSLSKSMSDFDASAVTAAEGPTLSVRLLNGAGQYEPYDISFLPLQIDDHDLTVLIFTVAEKDTSSSQDLLQSSSLFKQVFKLSPDPIVITRLGSGELVEGNSAFWNLVGMGQDGLKSLFDLWADDTVGRLMHQELVTKASIYNMPATVKTRGGIYRELRFFAERINFDDEDFVLIIGRDITDELDRERELQSNKEFAEIASRSKSEFLANMSHELRQPLNAIIGFSEILQDEIFGPMGEPKYTDYARDINSSGQHLLGIVNDILDLSKIEAGRFETDLIALDPFPSLEQCLRIVMAKASSGEIKLETAFDRTVRLKTDERLLKQIILNLLSNAVKFTPDNGMIICSMQRGSDGSITLGVADTGVGMSPTEMQQALQPFGQVGGSSSRNMEGTGLGLPLVKAIAEKLGARFLLDSSKGQGTQVRVVWPGSYLVDASEVDDSDLGFL